jgi:hypothetical protein
MTVRYKESVKIEGWDMILEGLLATNLRMTSPSWPLLLEDLHHPIHEEAYVCAQMSIRQVNNGDWTALTVPCPRTGTSLPSAICAWAMKSGICCSHRCLQVAFQSIRCLWKTVTTAPTVDMRQPLVILGNGFLVEVEQYNYGDCIGVKPTNRELNMNTERKRQLPSLPTEEGRPYRCST